MVKQAYLPKAYCWDRRSIQCAVEIRDAVNAFMRANPRMRVFSGLRRLDVGGDHRCGYAIDIVPLDFNDEAAARAAWRSAVAMWEKREVAYVEPWSLTWTEKNHHVHISFLRCKATLLQRSLDSIRSGGRR